MKKIIALLLALVMVIGLVACGNANTPAETDAPQADAPAETNAPAETDAPAETEAPGLYDEHVTLKYVIPAASDNYPGWDNIVAEVNKITEEKINATIEFELIPLGEYTDKMNMKFTAGEEFDVCFTGAWNPYLSAVSKGAYAELTEDVLNTYAPEFMAVLNPAAWGAVTVDGKIYGAPLQQIYVRRNGVRFATDLAEKYGFDMESVKTLDDLDEYLATIKENEPDAIPFYTGSSDLLNNVTSYMGFDNVVGTKTVGSVYLTDDSKTVVNQFASPEFKAVIAKIQEWAKAGYLPADAVTGAESASGKVRATSINPAYKPGGDVTDSNSYGYTVKTVGIGDAALTTSAINATVIAVSATSQNVERSVAFINLLNTDKDILNLICHGIEGTDYEFVDKDAGLIEVTSDYPGMYSFLIGNVFNEYYVDATQVGTWEETAEINANADASPLLGFTFNSEPVATQIAQCAAVCDEHLPSLCCGAFDDVDAALDAFLTALESAGASEIIAEMQAQVDAWK